MIWDALALEGVQSGSSKELGTCTCPFSMTDEAEILRCTNLLFERGRNLLYAIIMETFCSL